MLLFVEGDMNALDAFMEIEKHHLPQFVYRAYRQVVFEGDAWDDVFKRKYPNLTFREENVSWTG